jgi:long-chain acyl-CoA synthetase
VSGVPLRGRAAALLITDGGDERADPDFEALQDPPDSDHEPFATLDGADTAAIVYTSGTTGRPKGARLSHSTVVLNTLMTAQMHGRSSHDIVVSALPCTHVYGSETCPAIADGS